MNNPAEHGSQWQQLEARDRAASFFYGVRTTGIFCRPWCASRLPLRQNVEFFATAAEAHRAGYRACLRCRPEQPDPGTVAERISAYLQRNAGRRVPLAELGRIAGCSPFTAQRSFRAALGVSPAEYQRRLRAQELRGELRRPGRITDAVYAAGYGSQSRAYDRGGSLGMTPGAYRKGGVGEQIGYRTAQTALGWLLVAATARGLCAVSLGESPEELVAALQVEFPQAECSEDAALDPTLQAVLKRVAGRESVTHLPLDLRGTAFQMEVWQALTRIPSGETRSYAELAAELGRPRATRAVARACGQNRLAVVVPCHRVIGSNGSLTGYRWGLVRKQRLLADEAAGRQ